jgi:hypothetical protein
MATTKASILAIMDEVNKNTLLHLICCQHPAAFYLPLDLLLVLAFA